MEKSKGKKRKSKRKKTQFICGRCYKLHTAERSDAKYGKKCKKEESLERISKGFIYEIDGPLKNGLFEFYNEANVRAKNPFLPNPFKSQMEAYLLTKSADEMLRPWKHEFGSDFILYFFPNCKKQYDIFYSEKMKAQWKKYEISFLQKPRILKNHDLESGRPIPPLFS